VQIKKIKILSPEQEEEVNKKSSKHDGVTYDIEIGSGQKINLHPKACKAHLLMTKRNN